MTQDKAHPTPPAVPSEREAFEAWAREHLGRGYSLAMDEGVYLHPVTRWAFKAYKAGLAAPVASNTTAEPDLAAWLDGQEFHELAMDYRGAVLPDAASAAFILLQRKIRRAAGLPETP